MPSSYSRNLGLEKPATGEQAGVWGTTANSDYDFIDTATDGNLSIALSGSGYVLATQQGAVSEGRNKVIICTGALTASVTVNITPNTAQKLYLVTNATTGGFAVIFAQGTGGTFTLQPGYSAIIYCDGGGATANVTGALYNPQFGTVSIQTLSFTQPQNFVQPMTFNGALTFNGAVMINVPATTGAAGDLYYRSSAGPLARLPIGTTGQVLTVASGGVLSWAVGVAIGQPVSGSIVNAIFYSNASNVLAQDSRFTITANGLGIGTVAAHPLHLGPNPGPEVWLDTNNPGTQIRQLVWATNNIARWAVHSDAAAESGANAGSSLVFTSYSDSGAGLLNVLTLVRSSGNVTIGTYADMGARLFVLGTNPGQYVTCWRAAAGQSAWVSVWQNSAAAALMYLDNAGNLSMAGALSAASGSVTNNFTVGGTLSVGTASFSNLTVTGNLTGNTATFSGNVTVNGTTLTGPVINAAVGYSIQGTPGITTTVNKNGVWAQMVFRNGILISFS